MKTPNSKKPKTSKLVNVKGSLVNGKDGAYVKNAYQRKMLVNADQPKVKYPYITKQLNNSLRNAPVNGVEDLPWGEGGITPGVKVIKMEGTDGKEISGYFKDIDNDPVYKGGFVRRTVKLNTRTDGRQLDANEHLAAKKKPDHDKENLRGHMMDREVAAFALAKSLKMDHLPDATVRRLDVNGKKKLGVLFANIHEQFAEPGFTIKKASKDRNGDFYSMAKFDKKLGDKLAFDLLIGNTDRHTGNWMVKSDRLQTKAEMIAFDQGYSFPDSNNTYVGRDFGNQRDFHDDAGGVPLTSNFIENLGKFLTGEDFPKFINYVRENIGDREADAFTERGAFFLEKVFADKKTDVRSMGFLRHN